MGCRYIINTLNYVKTPREDKQQMQGYFHV